MRVNGKNWHAPRARFRPSAGSASSGSAFAKRTKLDSAISHTKTKEREMKAEKEAERTARIEAIKAKREAKAEKARWEEMQKKMSQRRIDRKKRREKRNKLLHS